MLKAIVLLVAMMSAAGVALLTAAAPEERAKAPQPTQYEIVSPEIMRVYIADEALGPMRDLIVSETGWAEVSAAGGPAQVPSRVDRAQSWPVGRDLPGSPIATRTTTTFRGAMGHLYTIETVETPGHATLVLLSATDRHAHPADTWPLVRALRAYFSPLAPVPHPE